MKNSCLYDNFVIELVAILQLGSNADTFMPIFSADTPDFLITGMFLEEGIIHFS